MKKFLEMVPLTYFDGQYKPSQNILIFMNKNGKEEVVRNC